MSSLDIRVEGVPDDITLITGPLLLGYMFNWGLFGILILQVYFYHISFPHDKPSIKCLVYFLFITDTVQTALTTHNAWHFLARGWGDPSVLERPGWSWIAVPLLSGIVSGSVQLFFAWRIWVLSRNWLLVSVIVLISLAQAVCAMISGIWFEVINDVTKISSLFPQATIWLGGSALTDLLITISMVTFLSRSHTGLPATDTMISKLIRIGVETGACTTTAAITELVLFLVYKHNNLHMIPALALAKLYSNTLLCTLNCRNPSFNHKLASNSTLSGSFPSKSKRGSFIQELPWHVGVGTVVQISSVHASRQKGADSQNHTRSLPALPIDDGLSINSNVDVAMCDIPSSIAPDSFCDDFSFVEDTDEKKFSRFSAGPMNDRGDGVYIIDGKLEEGYGRGI